MSCTGVSRFLAMFQRRAHEQPVICLFLAYENVLLALSNVLQDSSPLVHVGRTTRGEKT